MVKTKEKIFYGMGDFASNIAFGAISFYLMYFMIKIGGLDAKLAGVVFLIAKIWDAITDYLMGRISDKTVCKFGKRRIYMLIGSIPFGLSLILLWIVPTTDAQTLKMIYYTLVYMLFCTCWTIVYVPYNTLSANMTQDYDTRTSLTSYRIVLANIGILFGAAIFSLLAEGKESVFYGITQNQSQAYLLAGVSFGVLSCGCMLLCTFNVKERFFGNNDNTYGFFITLKQFFKLKEFRYGMVLYLLSMLGFDIIMGIYMFYVSDSLNFGGGFESMLFVALPLVCAMLSAPLWTYISKKKGKNFAYNFSAATTTATFILTLFIPQQNALALAIVSAVAGACMSGIQIIPLAILPDVVDIDNKVNGVRREGAFFGLTSFIYKLANGVGIGLVGVVLGLCGYIEGAGSYIDVAENFTQPDSALLAIRIILAFIPGIIFLISIIFSTKCRFTKENLNEAVEAVSKEGNN